MRIIRTIKAMQAHSRRLASDEKTIGIVPTMGSLHEGHLSLIRRAKKVADVVVTTIFVNPAQFAPHEDLAKYPRDEKGDLKKIKSAGGDVVFIPRADDIYPPDFQTWVDVAELTKVLEGASRPGHFRGVTTIVAKLFNIVRPDVAIFGQKDYQQAYVLKQMTRDLGYPLKYIIAPTVRETDGLAMSSRNKYFDADGRREATCLYNALVTARAMVKSGVADTKAIAGEMRAVVNATAPGAKIDYIAFTRLTTLRPADSVDKDTICSLAVRVRGVRLIDNMILR